MEAARIAWAAILGAGLVLAAACGSDGEGDGEDGGEQLDPGRKVDGCFDCSASEYCIIVEASGGETSYCAEPECGLECDCLMDEGPKRHAGCKPSCQEGSGLLYCFD